MRYRILCNADKKRSTVSALSSAAVCDLKCAMAEYIDEEELPLPSFFEIFGDGFQSAKKKRRTYGSLGGKLDNPLGDETTAGLV